MTKRKCVVIVAVLLGWLVSTSYAAVYQYAVPVADRTAYLWIPSNCRFVRGVIISFDNLTERKWLEDPYIREAASQECLGEVWLGHGSDAVVGIEMKSGSGEALLQMLRDFAEASGFRELAYAPVIAMGHSAHGPFAWNFAEWAPERTIAAIPVKTYPLPEQLQLKGVPLLYVVGETTEWPQYRDGRRGDRNFFWPVVQQSALQLRKQQADIPLGVATEPGGGHFDWSEAQARLIALYLRKACQYRLPLHFPKDAPPKLRPLDIKRGWLTDARGLEPDRYPPAPYSLYIGRREEAYWSFDRETALAMTAFNGDRKKRKTQMLTFRQDGKLLPVAKQGFAALKFEAEEDGVSFVLHPDFLSEVPEDLVGAGEPLGHAEGPIRLSVITGPVEQLGPNRFRLAMDRGNSGADLWIQEEQRGDNEYRKAVQPGKIHLPERFTAGQAQTIDFAPIPNQVWGSASIPLRAISNAGLPVRFFVEYGPAEVREDKLVLTQVPQRATKDIPVKVIAYQWGRLPGGKDKPAVQSALPVARYFQVLAGGEGKK